MTKKECKEAMLRGLGRCVIAVRREPEKYRDLVLWACKRDFAYDAQAEGTRSWYTYTMASCYSDKELFITAAADALRNYRPRGGWDLLHLSELLLFFAMDGYESARQALEDKYQDTLSAMLVRKTRPNGPFHELSDLERLGLVLTVDRKSFLRVAKDFGRLYRQKKCLRDGDFAWFFASKGSRYGKTMVSEAQKDEDVACFLQREQAAIAAREARRIQLQPETYTGIRLSHWLAKKADKKTVEQYALVYRQQLEPVQRAEALIPFARCPYPDDPQPIIGDAQSACEGLQNAAWQALENIRHPAVRAFGLNNTAKGIRTPENFALLVTNYAPEDAALLEALLREQIAAKDWDGIHAAGLDIFRVFDNDHSNVHPKHLLPLLYQYNPCSFCRESALRYMSRHRMLTRELLEECLYDSNEDIRRMAEKRLHQ